MMKTLFRKHEAVNPSDIIEETLTLDIGNIALLEYVKRNDGREEFIVHLKEGGKIYLQSMEECNAVYTWMEAWHKKGEAQV